MRLSLGIRFILVSIGIFAPDFVCAGWLANDLLQRVAIEETAQNARVVMEAADASQKYTATRVTPLLQTQMKYSLVPQSVLVFSESLRDESSMLCAPSGAHGSVSPDVRRCARMSLRHHEREYPKGNARCSTPCTNFSGHS